MQGLNSVWLSVPQGSIGPVFFHGTTQSLRVSNELNFIKKMFSGNGARSLLYTASFYVIVPLETKNKDSRQYSMLNRLYSIFLSYVVWAFPISGSKNEISLSV